MLTESNNPQTSHLNSSRHLVFPFNPTETHPRTRTNNIVAQELEKRGHCDRLNTP